MKFILGKKLNMEQVFAADGTVLSVTKVLAGPCLVTQKKDVAKDGYMAVQCAFGEKKKVNKSLLGKFKKFGDNKYAALREFRVKNEDAMYEKVSEGDVLTSEIFAVGDTLTIAGVSKGKGFQGVVKRHGFRGGKKSHGHKDQLRMPGSIGSTGPARVFKGMRMGGRMGGDLVTVTGLELVDIDAEKNILYIKGAIPGARNGLVKIVADGEFDIPEVKKVEEKNSEPKAEVKEEKLVEDKKEEVKKDATPKAEGKTEAEESKKEEKVEEKKEAKPEVKEEPKAENPEVEQGSLQGKTK